MPRKSTRAPRPSSSCALDIISPDPKTRNNTKETRLPKPQSQELMLKLPSQWNKRKDKLETDTKFPI